MKIFEGIKSIISFLTIIPSKDSTIEEISNYAYLFPLIGAFIGTICGIFGYILFKLIPNLIAAIFTLFSIMILTGLNHLDGLLDLGDALMFRGTKEERLKILHDKHHGIGGIFTVYFILTLTLATIILIEEKVFPMLILAECLAKLSILIIGCFAKPYNHGIGRIFILKVKEKRIKNLILGIFLSLLIVSIISFKAIFSFIIVLIFSLIWLKFLTNIFGCITGDMFGSINEISRVLSLMTIIFLGV
ncbi:MAG: adenosylcobinamide-GDP ribazoletransferase [Candidatus Methanomethylicaceae archaeon]